MIRFQVPAEQWSAFIPLRCVIRELDVIYALGQKDSRRSHSVSLFRTQHTLYSGVHGSHKFRPLDSARSVFRTKCLFQNFLLFPQSPFRQLVRVSSLGFVSQASHEHLLQDDQRNLPTTLKE